ncbi:head completion/stabilization protein [Larsenimonas suaedae]|uniref:Head completion/stabilization protein n=1 Tax=Larsenimonas suaedae TaxID=1851019 RepID=A0ABU1H040_9GAMM|nr:head completion/stabilization protein [Larsenimonas suaedae]MCM2973508.1 head completion/stabilization protein [Larsenimonas suaedae]MDR5897122.1 head completion/stabilization protein [Larsenimonas suaedae]
MSSFVATGNTRATPLEPIANNGFWPAIDPADFRDRHRVDGTVTPARLDDVLLTAIATTNRVLRHWQFDQIETGYLHIDAVPTPSWQPPSIYPDLYRRAVYAEAHAQLLERYRDYDATASTRDRGDLHDQTADRFRRDAHWAISEITGRGHVTVELI